LWFGAQVISYCVAVYRPCYANRLITDLVNKTSAPFEVLLWLNVDDASLESFVDGLIASGAPVRIVGKTTENIGMQAYRQLFFAARHLLIVQIDDDVVCISRRIAERAALLFDKFPKIRQLVADVWQDEFTTGARPPLECYRCVDELDGLYDGPIDGWFSIYHRSIRPLLLSLPYSRYLPIGGIVKNQLKRLALSGVLCTKMRVFHVIGPEYASFFGMLDFEIDKYRRLGRADIVNWYETAMTSLPPFEVLDLRVAKIARSLEEME
jgi:hypothetical protein